MPDAIEIIRSDHDRLRQLANSAGEAQTVEERQREIEALRSEVCLHTALSRDLFYPSIAAQMEPIRGTADAGRHEHVRQEQLISQLRADSGDAEKLHRDVEELIRAIDEHVTREEEQLLPRVESATPENRLRLGDLMAGRREEMVEEIRGGRWDLEQLEEHRTTVGDAAESAEQTDPSAIPRPPRGSQAARDVGVPGVVAEPEAYSDREGDAGTV